MTEIQREAIRALNEVWSLAPDVRLGQLMAHLGFLGEAHLGKGLGEIDDDELIAILYRHRAELKARSADSNSLPVPPPGTSHSVSGSAITSLPPLIAEPAES